MSPTLAKAMLYLSTAASETCLDLIQYNELLLADIHEALKGEPELLPHVAPLLKDAKACSDLTKITNEFSLKLNEFYRENQ